MVLQLGKCETFCFTFQFSNNLYPPSEKKKIIPPTRQALSKVQFLGYSQVLRHRSLLEFLQFQCWPLLSEVHFIAFLKWH